MSAKKQPICYIGAGKTTFALQYLPKIVSCNHFINADEIAKGVSPLNFEAGLLQASKIFLQSLNQKLESKETFAFETTLSGRSYLTQIPQWQQDGWNTFPVLNFQRSGCSRDLNRAVIMFQRRQSSAAIPEVSKTCFYTLKYATRHCALTINLVM